MITTAFCAVLDAPARAAAVLRARASAAGIDLRPADDTDLCAAVLEVHCWALATGRASLTGQLSPAEASGLAPALARAAGHGRRVPSDDWREELNEVSADVMARVAPVAHWALQHGGTQALRVAAHDMAGSRDERVVALAQHLTQYVDQRVH